MSSPRPPIRHVTFRSGELRFPPSCLDCGGAPDGDAKLAGQSRGVRVRLVAPFCKACSRGRLKRRIVWLLACLFTAVVWLGIIGVLQEGGLVAKRSPVLPIMTLILVIFCFVWRTREERIFHTYFSRIWIDAFTEAPPATIVLASRDEALLRSIAARGGAVEDSEEA
ncbi:MAG: hypothetical protein QM820_29250 [Minicystis sp.]